MASSQDVLTFRARFDAPLSVADGGAIGAALDMADIYLDPVDWMAEDFVTARMLWAAHWMTLQAQQGRYGLGMADLYPSAIRFGERELTFGRRQFNWKPGSPADAMLSMTTYGMMFIQLRNRNFPAIAVV